MLAFSIQFDASALELVDWDDSHVFDHFSKCDTKRVFAGKGRITFVCASKGGNRPVPPRIRKFFDMKFKVLARGAGIGLVPNKSMLSNDYTYSAPQRQYVELCRSVYAGFAMSGKTQDLSLTVVTPSHTVDDVTGNNIPCVPEGGLAIVHVKYSASDFKRTSALSFQVLGINSGVKLEHIEGPKWQGSCAIAAMFAKAGAVTFSCAALGANGQPAPKIIPASEDHVLKLTLRGTDRHGPIRLKIVPDTALVAEGYTYEIKTSRQSRLVNTKCWVSGSPTPAPLPSTPAPTPFPRTFMGIWKYTPSGAKKAHTATIHVQPDNRVKVSSPGEFWSPTAGHHDANVLVILGMQGKLGAVGKHIRWSNGMVWHKWVPKNVLQPPPPQPRRRHHVLQPPPPQSRRRHHVVPTPKPIFGKLKASQCHVTAWSTFSKCPKCGHATKIRLRSAHPLKGAWGMCPQKLSDRELCTYRKCTDAPTPAPKPKACPAGTFMPDPHTCQKCPRGKHSPVQSFGGLTFGKKSKCEWCPLGFLAPQLGMAQCMRCPAWANCKGAIQRPTPVPTPRPRTLQPPPAAGLGWKLVRRVKAGAHWHPAADFLHGTAVYGTPKKYGDAKATWSVSFAHDKFDEFCFATGDNAMWLVAAKDQVLHTQRGLFSAVVKLSSKSSKLQHVKWYNRGPPFKEDPWISAVDHNKAKHTAMLYGGNSEQAFTNFMSKHVGANVWIRHSAAGLQLEKARKAKALAAQTAKAFARARAPTPKPNIKFFTKANHPLKGAAPTPLPEKKVKTCVLKPAVKKLCLAHQGCCRKNECHLFGC